MIKEKTKKQIQAEEIEKLRILYAVCFIGFLCSAILKSSQGSSTSSMIIVSSIIFPIIFIQTVFIKNS